MRLLAVAALAYYLSLQFVFPGYFHPLTPHHDDFYFPPGLSFDGHAVWEKLHWPRPLGFLMMQLLGKLGLHGYLLVLVVITLANTVLTITLARRIFGRPISWILVFAYCGLVFAHPDFYVNYLHDAFGTLSYFYLILAMHAWYRYRERNDWRYGAACAVLALLIAFTKETYFLSALCFWLVQIYLCRGAQRRAAILLLASCLVFFATGVGANAYSMTNFLHVKTDASSPYHVSLAPAAVGRALLFYARRLLHPAVLLLVAGGIAILHREREQMMMAGTLLVAGICAVMPYAVLPNHLDSMYAWTGAMLAFSPVLFLSQPAPNWRMAALYEAVAVLVIISIVTSSGRYKEHRWTVEQEKINGNILAAYPVLKGAAGKILISGLSMPFQPFHTASYIRAEFGPQRLWTVVIPKGSPAKSEATVRLSQPEAVQLKDFDRAFGFDDDGRLVQRSGHAQLQAAATRQQMDRILFPALNAPFDALAKDPGNWDAALRAGIVYSQWGEWDSAADFLVRSAELNHYQNPYPLFFLGKVRQSQGMLDEARRCFAQAVALSAGERNPAFQEAIEQLRKK